MPASFSCFFFYCFVDPRDLHSFPTRRSSDLDGEPRLARAREPAEIGRDPVHRPSDLCRGAAVVRTWRDRKSTRLNSSHVKISYAVFCLKKKQNYDRPNRLNASMWIRTHGEAA